MLTKEQDEWKEFHLLVPHGMSINIEATLRRYNLLWESRLHFFTFPSAFVGSLNKDKDSD